MPSSIFASIATVNSATTASSARGWTLSSVCPEAAREQWRGERQQTPPLLVASGRRSRRQRDARFERCELVISRSPAPCLRSGSLASPVMTDAVPEFASPSELPAPAGYSHVVRVPAGELVWTSGQVGISADGSVPDGWEGQTRMAFENVGRALGAAGAGWTEVIKLTFYVVAVDELATVRRVRDEYVDTRTPPTSSLVQVAGLFRPDLLIEVEAVAWTSLPASADAV